MTPVANNATPTATTTRNATAVTIRLRTFMILSSLIRSITQELTDECFRVLRISRQTPRYYVHLFYSVGRRRIVP